MICEPCKVTARLKSILSLLCFRKPRRPQDVPATYHVVISSDKGMYVCDKCADDLRKAGAVI